MATTVIVVVAVLFLGMGGYGLAAPAALTRPFGIALSGPAARAEVRAVYGGFGLAVGALLVTAALGDGEFRDGVVVAVAVALLGMAAGRLLARFAEAQDGFYPSWFYFWVEVVAGGALLAAVGF
ncbi:MAG TPA: DUF4345 family protein [Pseudonocardiaceae bacterium]